MFGKAARSAIYYVLVNRFHCFTSIDANLLYSFALVLPVDFILASFDC